jgi:hypothetical protein
MRPIRLLLSVLLALTTAAAVLAKSEAPVDMYGTARGGTASVVLRFSQPMRDVTVRAWGVDGVKVGASTVSSRTSVAAGSEITVTVPYTVDATGNGYVVVDVKGSFGGLRTGKIRAFAVGVPAAHKAGKTVKGGAGQPRIIELPGTVVP